MKAGIAPELLVSQVKNTAGWLWTSDDPRVKQAVEILSGLDKAKAAQRNPTDPAYLALLLTAHYATVATFVPTDVDARIRHHQWQEITKAEDLERACEIVDLVASFDARAVSDRFVVSDRLGALSGHDGEWLAVRAGALGRAAAIGADKSVERLTSQLDAEVEREEAIFVESLADSKNARRTLSVATIVAHNLGDLSRVVEEWPKNEVLKNLRAQWTRLGHPDSPGRRAPFVKAGAVNKALMAHENHRFLPLRKPKALRTSRDLLLPIGPWFDAWGETIAKSEHLENRDRAEVLAALLEVHGRDASQEGCLRAIAGMHHALRGGIEVLVPDLPARMRKDAVRGKVREVLDITADRFATRIDRKFHAL